MCAPDSLSAFYRHKHHPQPASDIECCRRRLLLQAQAVTWVCAAKMTALVATSMGPSVGETAGRDVEQEGGLYGFTHSPHSLQRCASGSGALTRGLPDCSVDVVLHKHSIHPRCRVAERSVTLWYTRLCPLLAALLLCADPPAQPNTQSSQQASLRVCKRVQV